MPTATYEVEWWNGSAWTAVADANVVGVDGGADSGLADAGVGFGDVTTTSATVELLLSAEPAVSVRTPVRITLAIDASSSVAFQGVIRNRSGDLDTVRWECQGYIEDLAERTKDLYSPLYFRRPPATETTASSIEDPSDGSYAAGLINWTLWQAGGRPEEQSGTYPTADFYYSCDQAVRAPDWSWVAGENGWEEARRLARAVGGQLYQDMDGVIRYRNPLNMISATADTYTNADYAGIDWSVDPTQLAATINATYTPRYVQPSQELINDTTPRVVAASSTLTFSLESSWPLVSVVLDGGTLKANNIIAAFFDGRVAPYHATTGFTTTTTITAMRITIAVTNNTAWNMQITKVTISGQPLAAGETGNLSVGSGKPVKNLEDNIFVQSRSHAQALASMALAFYGTARASRTLKEMVYDPAREIGDTVALTESALGLSSTQHIILGKRHSETGILMDLTLIDATGLPQQADYWLCSSTVQSGTKKVGW